jgi:hypothetical protein
MLKKLVALLFTAVLALLLSTPVFAQEKSTKQARVEGPVVRSSKDNSTLTVRTRDMGGAETVVHYDGSTRWTSQEHHSKKVNNIDSSEVKDGDYVIALGTYDDKKEFHAAMISKRLSHSPK